MLEKLSTLYSHVKAAVKLLATGATAKGDKAVDEMALASAAWEALMAEFARSIKGQRAKAKLGKIVRAEAEEETAAAARREAVELRTPLSILEGDAVDERTISPATRELCERLRTVPAEVACELLHDLIITEQRAARLMTIRAMIRYMWHDAKNPWEFMKRGLAITRRYIRDLIVGMSMTEVSELLDETRAATSAREGRIHDTLLIRWGVIAPKAADGGLKSAGHCAKARRAAMGNTNRRHGRKTSRHKT